MTKVICFILKIKFINVKKFAIELAEELDIFPQTSQSIKAKSEESLLSFFADQDVQVNAERQFSRSQSCFAFFSPEQLPKDNQFNLRTTKSNAELCGIQSDAPSFSSALDVFSISKRN